MHEALLILHVLVAVAIVALVLLQRGRGAEVGAAFGSGASSTVFGAQGSATFLSRTTAVLAAVFFLTSLTLAFLSTGGREEPKSVTELVAPADEGAAAGQGQAPEAGRAPAADLPADLPPVSAPAGDEAPAGGKTK